MADTELLKEEMQESIEINIVINPTDETKESFRDDTSNDSDIINDDEDGIVYDVKMSLKCAFSLDIDIYEAINWKLSIYVLVLSIITCGTYLIGGGGNIASIIIIILYILILIIHIIAIILCFIRKRKNNNNTIHDELNLLLGIKKKDNKNIYNLDSISTHYVGTIFFILIINLYLLLLINRIMYPNPGGNKMCISVINGYPNGYGACLQFGGFNSVIGPTIGLMLALLCCQFYTIKDDVVLKMMKFKDSKILTIKNSKIGKTLNEKISGITLKKWSNSLSFTQRKGEYCILFIPAAAIIIIRSPEAYRDIHYNNFIDILIYSWLCISGTFTISLIFYFFMSTIRYFRYPYLIMESLTEPIEGNNISDFILWWQLRKYYIENEVRISSRIQNVMLTVAFLVSLITLTFTIKFVWSEDNLTNLPSYVYKFMLFTVVLLGLILYLAQNASLYYEEQLRHKNMLYREKLCIESKKYDKNNNLNDDGNVNTRNDEQLLRVIDAMIIDVKHNVIAIKISGIKITPNIMLLIRGYIASGFLTIAVAYF